MSHSGLPMSILYWTITATASKQAWSFSFECRKPALFMHSNSAILPLSFSWRQRARLLNLDTSAESYEFGKLISLGYPLYPLSAITFFPRDLSLSFRPFCPKILMSFQSPASCGPENQIILLSLRATTIS
jgi:hypothetical protein